MSYTPRRIREQVRPSTKRRFFWTLLGPGIISLLANNDAGGVICYAMTGARFGISFFLPLLFLLAPVAYQFQEMSTRLAAVTRAEYRQSLLLYFGRSWSLFSVSALALANLLYIVAEFAGMTAGLAVLGVPLWAGDLLSLHVVGAITIPAGYRRKERFALLVGLVNTVFIAAAILSHPPPSVVARAFTTWPAISWDLGPDAMLVFLAATIGNAVAPFMLYFQTNATLDKGITAQDLPLARSDNGIGALLQPVFAMAVMIGGASLAGTVAHLATSRPADLISALVPAAGRLTSDLFAIGLFNAGWLAAITISLSSAYAVAGALGARRSLDDGIAEAPGFYGVYLGSLVIGALIILIPRLPLNMIAVFTQIIAAVLLVPDLIFLVLLTSNPGVMGQHTNRWGKQFVGWTIVALYAAMSAVSISVLVANL